MPATLFSWPFNGEATATKVVHRVNGVEGGTQLLEGSEVKTLVDLTAGQFNEVAVYQYNEAALIAYGLWTGAGPTEIEVTEEDGGSSGGGGGGSSGGGGGSSQGGGGA